MSDEVKDQDLQVEMVGPVPEPVQGCHLGLRLEAGGKRVSHTTFEDKIGCLTKEQIGKILADPKRTPARVEFGVDWILNQGQRSSCAPYALAAVMEKATAVRTANASAWGRSICTPTSTAARTEGPYCGG